MMRVLRNKNRLELKQQAGIQKDLHLARFSYSLLQIKLMIYCCQPQQGTDYVSSVDLKPLKNIH